MEKTGIQQTREALDFLLDFFLAMQNSVADDNRITLRDAPNFLQLAWKAPTAVGGISQIPREFSDLGPLEKQDLFDLASRKFDLPNDELETLIERTFTLVVELADLGADWVAKRRSE